MKLKAMSDLSHDNLVNNRILDEWLVLAVEDGVTSEMEQQSVDQLLFWWLGFDDRDEGSPDGLNASSVERQITISVEDAKRSRARRLLRLALQCSEASHATHKLESKPQPE